VASRGDLGIQKVLIKHRNRYDPTLHELDDSFRGKPVFIRKTGKRDAESRGRTTAEFRRQLGGVGLTDANGVPQEFRQGGIAQPKV